MPQPLAITELVLRDGHQSLFATRLRTQDMLPVAKALDDIGYWSIETWGGATFDACIRYLGEDPWQRLRALKDAMPNTPQQMLLRGQNLLGYRHYADDMVRAFVQRAVDNGMDIFRIFDAMNDVRNLDTAVKATVAAGAHAQGTLSYTVSPAHDIHTWVDMAKRLADLGCQSLCIKDMAGLLKPYVAQELVTRIKEAVELPISLHCHATTGLSTATLVKAAEAGVDVVDTSISSMSMTYGHSATEALIAIYEDHPRATGLDLAQLAPIADYFRDVRQRYAAFEGSLRGIDARILTAQVPGGMLTNMENQLKEQGMADRLDEVLREVPRVRKDLGYIPLVTPTSQIVGTQAVLNVMTGERYRSITKETKGVVTGEYGTTPAAVDPTLREQVLAQGEHDPILCRPADLLPSEMQRLTGELQGLAMAKDITLSERLEEDVLIHAMFPQTGLNFLENRDNPEAFEPHPDEQPAPPPATATDNDDPEAAPESYHIVVNGNAYDVQIAAGGEVRYTAPAQAAPAPVPQNAPAGAAPAAPTASTSAGDSLPSPLAGSIFKVLVKEGERVAADQVLFILEAMKMETQVRSLRAGTVTTVRVREGDAVKPGDPLCQLAAE